MEPENFVDPIDLLRRLGEKRIRYLLVGRQAVVQYGAPLQSFDFDFYVSPDEADLENLMTMAREMGLEIESANCSGSPPMLRLLADNVSFDFIRARSYTNREGTVLVFDDMWRRRRTFGEGDLSIHVPCLEDLVATKKMRDPSTAGGLKDAEDLRYLSVIGNVFEKP